MFTRQKTRQKNKPQPVKKAATHWELHPDVYPQRVLDRLNEYRCTRHQNWLPATKANIAAMVMEENDEDEGMYTVRVYGDNGGPDYIYFMRADLSIRECCAEPRP